MKINAALTATKAQRPALGAWVMLPGAHYARHVAVSSPAISWIVVDCEHGLIPLGSVADSVTAIVTSSSTPPAVIVRIPATGTSTGVGWQIKLALDAGASGIMVPMVDTADQAKEFTSWARFPPQGQRGFGSPFTPTLWDTEAVSYINDSNSQMLTIAQIETPKGVENVDEIAKVNGLDCLLIGPFDLSISHGLPPPSPDPHPEAEKIIAKIRQSAKSAGKLAAIYCVSPEQAARRISEGFDLVNVWTDAGQISNSIVNAVKVAGATTNAEGAKSLY